jgi:trehalose 6-phosphate phosphatase
MLMYWQDATETLLKPLLKQPRLGLITDMDGTISPIVAVPDAAQVTPRSRELLRALGARLALVAVVSGRAVADVRQRVGLPELVYAGNHGLERWVDDRIVPTPQAAPFRPALEAVLAEIAPRLLPGMRLEDKGATLSLHYRQTDDPQAAAAAFTPLLEAAAAQHGLSLFQGRMVFELRPPLEIHKGTILRQLVSEYRLSGAVYLGDDTTDADALRMARSLRHDMTCYALGLGVESEGVPTAVLESADLLAAGVPGVESFLAWLVNALSAS